MVCEEMFSGYKAENTACRDTAVMLGGWQMVPAIQSEGGDGEFVMTSKQQPPEDILGERYT